MREEAFFLLVKETFWVKKGLTFSDFTITLSFTDW